MFIMEYVDKTEKEVKRQQKIDEISRLLHEEWRLSRFNKKTGQYESRFKPTKDENWIRVHDNKKEVDLASTSFEELPEDWKSENRIASGQAMDMLEDVLVLIHDRWLERNEARSMDEQRVRYAHLSKEDKEKDLVVLSKALKVFKKNLK